MGTSTSAASRALLGSLRATITVSFRPLASVVARLDTTTTPWVLLLDSDSPVQDHCWAMIDVLRILTFGTHAAESARHVPVLRLLQPPAAAPWRRTPPRGPR